MQQSSASNNGDLVLGWLSRLSKHFGTELSEDQLEIFVNALAKNSSYQISASFERCLNECQFMPKLKEVHERMPEQREKRTSAAFVAQEPPIIDVLRPIARKLYSGYDELDAMKPEDAKVIRQVTGQALREYWHGKGIKA